MALSGVATLILCFTSIWAIPVNHQQPKSLLTHPFNANPRIIGGSVARAGQFPYAVSITKRTTGGNFFCAGALISNKWIVTAGHCVVDAIDFTLHVGTNNRQGADGQTVSTPEFVLNPNYSDFPLMNDIGLIELRLQLTFTDYLRPIDLFPTAELMDGSTVITIGWGTTSDENEAFSDSLNYATVTNLPNEECKLVYGDQITDEKVCVEGNYNQGTCVGDSGGPLIQYASRGMSILVGISSFISQNGCEGVEPSGFTRVFPFRDWIRDTTGV